MTTCKLLYYFLAGYAPPQPLRLLDTEWCSVELVVGQTHDHSLQSMPQTPVSSCYHTILHWYGTDGSHAKLDLRKLIRKAAKDVSGVKYDSYMSNIVCPLLTEFNEFAAY